MAFNRQVLGHDTPALGRQTRAYAVGAQRPKGQPPRQRIPGREELSSGYLTGRFEMSPRGGGDDRHAGSHRLNDREPERFGHGGGEDHARAAQFPRNV